ncbi:MAG TPA: hypothetical protein ENJ90_03300 [Devosia sp.]|nr:hypothetical protein [Devosia sp.]
MSISIKTIVAAVLALSVSAAHANPLDLQGGGQVKPRVTAIQLGVQAADNGVCPAPASLNIWVFSNKPGTFPVLLVADNGVVLGPYQVETVKGANNVTLGSWTEDFIVASSVSTKYRAVTPNSDVASMWVPLEVTC